jgi:hypothetical protein
MEQSGGTIETQISKTMAILTRTRFRESNSGEVAALIKLVTDFLVDEIVPSLPAEGIRQTDKQM